MHAVEVRRESAVRGQGDALVAPGVGFETFGRSTQLGLAHPAGGDDEADPVRRRQLLDARQDGRLKRTRPVDDQLGRPRHVAEVDQFGRLADGRCDLGLEGAQSLAGRRQRLDVRHIMEASFVDSGPDVGTTVGRDLAAIPALTPRRP